MEDLPGGPGAVGSNPAIKPPNRCITAIVLKENEMSEIKKHTEIDDLHIELFELLDKIDNCDDADLTKERFDIFEKHGYAVEFEKIVIN